MPAQIFTPFRSVFSECLFGYSQKNWTLQFSSILFCKSSSFVRAIVVLVLQDLVIVFAFPFSSIFTSLQTASPGPVAATTMLDLGDGAFVVMRLQDVNSTGNPEASMPLHCSSLLLF